MEKKEDEKELSDLLNLKIEALDDLDILGEEESDQFKVNSSLLEIQSMAKDEQGLKNLQQHAFVVNIEKQILEGDAGIPTGIAFSENLTQYKVGERADDYKSNIQDEYHLAVKKVELLYKALARGFAVQPIHISRIVQHFMKVFSRDAELLLNLSTLQPSYSDYLYNHALRVCLLSLNISSAAGYSENQVLDAGQAGLLADVGMMICPEKIRFKNDKITAAEEFEIRKAPMLGLYTLEKVVGLRPAIAFATYQHHERIGGQGYPNRRNGRIIHNFAKIVAIADVFQALCSKRSYRDAFMPHHAMVKIIQMSLNHELDPFLVKKFVSSTCLFPIGSFVKLSDGTTAKVISSNYMKIDRPQVSVLYDKQNRSLEKSEVYQINLAEKSDVRIEKSIFKNVDSTNVMDGF